MTEALSSEHWLQASDTATCELLVRRCFGNEYTFRRWVSAGSSRAQVYIDSTFGLEWVLAPSGQFRRGFSPEEEASARALNPDPLLNIEEMRPTATVKVDAFLVLMLPLSVAHSPESSIDSVGPAETLLCSEVEAIQLASTFGARLPSEKQWEYACRAGSGDLFWFGASLPHAGRLEHLLGLKSPAEANRFGLSSLFFGEWCSDIWRKDLREATTEDTESGRVIRGGAARFWPWQDSREWSGCVSAFRMPAKDSAGAGAAVRLVRERQV